MWLVIPKTGAADIHEWGLNEQFTSCIGVKSPPSNGVNAQMVVKRCSCDTTGYDFIVKCLDNCEVWMLDPRSRQKENLPIIPEDLAKRVSRVFVHFGGTNLEDMDLKWINDEWKKTRELLQLPEMPNAEIMPMSNVALPWSGAIQNFRSGFISGTPFTLECLNNAWNSAFTYFHIDQSMQALIEALFPLFVDLSNHEISALSEIEINKAYSAAKNDLETRLSGIMATSNTPARDLFKGGLKSIKDSSLSETTRNCAKAGFELLELLEKENLTSADHSAFKMKFEGLSEAYSLHLGLGPVAPATA